MYHMELALIMYRGDNDYHARFIRLFYFSHYGVILIYGDRNDIPVLNYSTTNEQCLLETRCQF